jgi:hypothetical protein
LIVVFTAFTIAATAAVGGVAIAAVAVAIAIAAPAAITVAITITAAKPMHYLCSRCKGCLIFMGV